MKTHQNCIFIQILWYIFCLQCYSNQLFFFFLEKSSRSTSMSKVADAFRQPSVLIETPVDSDQMTKNYHHLLLQQLTSEDHLIVWFQRFFIFLISLSSIVCTCSCSGPIDFNIRKRRLLRRAAGRNHFSNCATTAWTLNCWGYMPWQISIV